MTGMTALHRSVLPARMRSRLMDNNNGLRMHILEVGFETRSENNAARHFVFLLRGCTELAHSWRKVMLPLAPLGYHVVTPDQRGYGRTTGWDGNSTRAA